jgi:hypothetical protein
MAQSLKDLLPQYSKKKKLEKTLVATRVLLAWPNILSTAAATVALEDCSAVAYKTGMVTIQVAGSTLANEMRFHEDTVLSLYGKLVGEGIVKRIYWRIR